MPQPRIVWRELWTCDPRASATFLEQLFGWRPDPASSTLLLDGRPVAGLRAIGQEVREPSRWLLHVAVDALEAAPARVERAGGRVAQRIRVAGLGVESLLIQDRVGAELALFEGASASHIDAGDHGEPSRFWWSELACPAPREAVDFYRDVFGWSSLEAPLGDLDLRFFLDGERRVASAVQDPWLAGGTAAWLSYVLVTELGAACERAVRAGGRLERDPVVVPGMGSFASLADPTGARLALWQHEDALASAPATRS